MRLAGTTFIRNGVQYDYHFEETILCLLQFCEHVFVVDAGSNDGTLERLIELQKEWEGSLTVICCSELEWDAQHGKEKLSYFSNIAINKAREAGYDYHFYLQCDEVLHEKSYPYILKAVTKGEEGFMVTRHNLWGSPYRLLDVPQDRKPCSTNVIRLTKTEYVTVDDAENIAAPNLSFEFIDKIVIYHMGFVRRRSVMVDKIKNMQVNVFGMGYDKKLDESEVFNAWLWFDKEKDTKFINEPLPKIIREWAAVRAGDYE